MKMTIHLLYAEYCNQRVWKIMSYGTFYNKFRNDLLTFSQLLEYEPQEKVKWRTTKQWYKDNREYCIEYNKAYQAGHLDYFRKYMQKTRLQRLYDRISRIRNIKK